MPKTAFDPDELSAAAGKLKGAAGKLHGIGTRATSAANDLTGDPQAGALASDSVSIFSDLSSLHGNLDQTAKDILGAVSRYQSQAQSGPPSPPSWLNLGPTGNILYQAAAKDLQSWQKKHPINLTAGLEDLTETALNGVVPGVPGATLWNAASSALGDAGSWWQKNHLSALQNIATVSGLVSAVAGGVAALPIPGVDVVAAAVAEGAGAVNVGADVALIAYGDRAKGVYVDLGLATAGLATGGVSRGLGKAAEMAGKVGDAEDAVKQSGKGVEAAKSAESDANEAAATARDTAKTQETLANLSPGRSRVNQVLANKDAEEAASQAKNASQNVTKATDALTNSQKNLEQVKAVTTRGNVIKQSLKAVPGVDFVRAAKAEIKAGQVAITPGVVVSNLAGVGAGGAAAAIDMNNAATYPVT